MRRELGTAIVLRWIVIAALCALIVAASLWLTQCAPRRQQPSGPANGVQEPAVDHTPSDTAGQVGQVDVGLPNPILDHYNLEEMVATTGVEMTVPAEAEVVSYQSINKEMNQIEVLFRGATYTLRKARSSEADISGFYERWGTVEKMRAPNADVGEVTVSRSSDRGVVTWNDGTYAHSIAASQGFDIANALSLVMP